MQLRGSGAGQNAGGPGLVQVSAGGLLQQASIPVQVPISTSNGQTIYQTVHFPIQAFAQPQPQPQMVPSQMQIIPQLAQVIYFVLLYNS